MQVVHSTYIRTSEITQKCLFHCVSLWLKTKSKMPNFFVFIFVNVAKENKLSPDLSFWIATTIKIKTKQFCISYLVFSHQKIQRDKHKNEKKMKTCPCFSSFPSTQLHTMAIRVVEFSSGGYKIKKIFA